MMVFVFFFALSLLFFCTIWKSDTDLFPILFFKLSLSPRQQPIRRTDGTMTNMGFPRCFSSGFIPRSVSFCSTKSSSSRRTTTISEETVGDSNWRTTTTTTTKEESETVGDHDWGRIGRGIRPRGKERSWGDLFRFEQNR